MSQPQYVTVSDLSEWIGEPIEDGLDTKRAARVIQYAQTLCQEYAETTWDQTEVPEAVKMVVLQVAGRGYLNPESWASEGLDDWRGGGRPIEEVGMYLTATERRILDTHRAKRARGIGMISTYRDEPRREGYWVPTPDGADILWGD